MKMNKKRLLQLLLILPLLLVLLRLVGFIEFNFYTANSNGTQTGSFSKTDTQKSYQINFEYNDEIIKKHAFTSSEQEKKVITARIEPYIYDGNYFMPFYKKFSMHYTCTFATQTDTLDNEITESNPMQGHVEGTVEMEVIGLCTAKKAKTLVNEKAFDSISDFVLKAVNP